MPLCLATSCGKLTSDTPLFGKKFSTRHSIRLCSASCRKFPIRCLTRLSLASCRKFSMRHLIKSKILRLEILVMFEGIQIVRDWSVRT